MAAKFLVTIAAIFLSCFFLVSCGLEDFEYMDNIPHGIANADGSEVIISLPPGIAEGYNSFFKNFVIFYRIYLSPTPFADTVNFTGTTLSAVNAALANNYNYFYNNYFVANSTGSTLQIDERAFANRNYYKLSIEGGTSIDSVLSSNSLGRILRISFSGDYPALTLETTGSQITSGPHNLHRAINGPGFRLDPNEPKPDQYFLYHSEMLDISKEDNINLDIQDAQNSVPVTAYVSMYIVARGLSASNYNNIFSRPAFIGIFELK